MLHFLGVCAVIWMIWVIFFKKQVPQSVSPASPKAQEIFNKYRDLKPYTVEQSIIEEQLDIQLHAIKDTALYSPELIGMVNKFLETAMTLNDADATVAYVRIILCNLKVQVNPKELLSFNEFHQKYGARIHELFKT